MSAVDKIRAVLGSRLLMPELLVVPSRGATRDELHDEQALMGRALCPEHVDVLRQWNGIDLEVIRLFGCGNDTGEIGRLSARQLEGDSAVVGLVVVGADPSGFVYLQGADQTVSSLDTDGGEFEQLADDLDDLFERVVFGPDAASFAGDEWLSALRDAGITSA